MNDILNQLQTLMTNSLVAPFAVKRVEIGLYSDSKTLRNNDYPAVWIEPVNEEIAYSNWANNLTKEYSVRVYIIMQLRNPKQAQVRTQATFQGKNLNQYCNEITRILGTNKLLTGTVRLQSDRFTIENFQDGLGREVKSVGAKYLDDLIPYASQTINQSDMIKQI